MLALRVLPAVSRVPAACSSLWPLHLDAEYCTGRKANRQRLKTLQSRAESFMTVQELLAAARASMDVPFRPDGPPMAYHFDARPQQRQPNLSGGKRKPVMLDQFEVESQPDGGFQAKKRHLLSKVRSMVVQQGLSAGLTCYAGCLV